MQNKNKRFCFLFLVSLKEFFFFLAAVELIVKIMKNLVSPMILMM